MFWVRMLLLSLEIVIRITVGNENFKHRKSMLSFIMNATVARQNYADSKTAKQSVTTS